MSEHSRPQPPQPYLLEVAGVAGSGKSTLTDLLCAQDGYVRGAFIHTRTPAHLVYVTRSLPRLVPVLISGAWRAPRMTWREFKLMAYVTGWRRFFDDRPEYRGRVAVLDQGPIYALVRLRALDSGVARTRSFRRWWHAMLDAWADRLDTLVSLDAPDEVLLARIDGRAQSHVVKGEQPDVSLRFITHYRNMFATAICTLEPGGQVRSLAFDTDQLAAQDVAAEVTSAISTRHGGST